MPREETALPTNPPPLLEARGLCRSFGGVRAVDDVSFSLDGEGIIGLIGPNGAGKTTLFNLIAGNLRPSAGTLRFRGEPIDGLTPNRIFARGIARTFQIPKPFAAMSVLENVMVAPMGQTGEHFWANWLMRPKVAAEERRCRERAMEFLSFVTLDPLARAPARTLSGGQRKLLELARVLMADPALILLDEPGAGVNPVLLETIIEKITELHARGIAFLVIEHNMDLVMRLCRPILVMAEGRLLLKGTAEQVQADPRVVEAYFGGAMA